MNVVKHQIGLIIIGDEILSGKRQDKHMAKVIEIVRARGLQLAWCEYLGDDSERCTATFARTFAWARAAPESRIVFSCGGIGATPDDHTRQCAAAALGVSLQIHPEAEAAIRLRSAEAKLEITPQRLEMGNFPLGSAIIPNSYNRIPGFAIARHYFVPGFPVMAWPMVEWVLDTHYQSWHHQTPHAERAMLIVGIGESQVIDLMKEIEARWGVTAFSLPSIGGDGKKPHIELGCKGAPVAVEGAFARLVEGVKALGVEPELLVSAGDSR